jgi:hypothetical protein
VERSKGIYTSSLTRRQLARRRARTRHHALAVRVASLAAVGAVALAVAERVVG